MTEQNNTTTYTRSLVTKVVMVRVNTIHALQALLSTTTLSIALFILSLWGIGREVWVARVLKDEPAPTLADAVALFHFYLSAFLDTRFIVQALTLLTVAAFVWFVYNAFSMLQQASRVSVSRVRLQ
jgi:hypothetical protein